MNTERTAVPIGEAEGQRITSISGGSNSVGDHEPENPYARSHGYGPNEDEWCGLHITFESGDRLSIFDDDRFCCESRYMVHDDDSSHFVGAKLMSVMMSPVGTVEDRSAADSASGWDCDDEDYYEPECEEVVFVDVNTDRGTISVHCHNVHNGYYSGINVVAVFTRNDGNE